MRVGRPFSAVRRLRDNWELHGRVSVRTVDRRLNCGRLQTHRPIKRELLNRSLRQVRHQWSCEHRNSTLRQWRRVHWSDESRLLLRHIDGCMRV